MKIFIKNMSMAGIIILLPLIFAQSCDRNHLLHDNNGTLSISVSLESARAAAPDLSQDDFSFNIYGDGPGDSTFYVETSQGATTALVNDLAFGTWEITVEALYYGEPEAVSFGDGVATALVHSGYISECPIVITPFEGQGNLDITVNWDNAEVENPELEGSLSRIGFDPVEINFTMGTGQATASLTLDSGIYTASFVLNDGEDYEYGGVVDSVRITNALTTAGEYTIIGTPAPDTEAPTVPTNLSATNIQSYRVSLSWNASTDNRGVTGYRVYRGGSPIGTSSDTAYADTMVVASTLYTYTVTAYDAEGNESGHSESIDVSTPEAASVGQIIADHTVVDRYDDIPEYYINEVKKMYVQVIGESHSAAYRDGLDLLEDIYNSFQAETQEQGENDNIPLGPTDQYLRLNRLYWNGSWWFSWGGGEEIFWTTQWARDRMKTNIAYCNGTGANPLTAIGFGWCWDITDTGDRSELDTEYGVHWYGRSYYWNGSDTDENYGAWGLDSSDYSITGNLVSMETYCLAVEEIDASSDSTVCFFTTGPSDSTEETGYQRWLKHAYIRDWVSENGGVLFDYADILNYNDAGELATTSWDGHTYPILHPDNDGEDTGHIGNTGALRLAKAMWWMLARIAGWDGN